MTPQEKNFEDYKRVQSKALEIMKELKAVSPKKADIELAMLVAIFELHKGELPAGTIGKIIEGHLNELVNFYSQG